MDAALSADWAAWLAEARGWLQEFAEEGLERIEPFTEAQRAPDPTAPPAPVLEASTSELFAEGPSWGADTTLESVRAALGECTRCRLCEQRTKIVFGDGNPRAELMFVGEGPGAEEDRTGLPFVGRAGELLTAMIERGRDAGD